MMHVDTEKVARRALAWHRAGLPCWWVTVLSTFGSSNAPPGSVLAVSESEAWLGSLGMPNIDQAVARRVLASAPVETLEWVLGAQAETAHALGFPVGADPVVVRVERVQGDKVAGLEELAKRLSRRESVARNVGTGLVQPAQPFARVMSEDGETVVHHPSWRLIMTSTTPLSIELCERAARVGFVCDVIEPRDTYQLDWPKRASLSHCRLHTTSVNTAMATMPLDERTAVLALAHAPEVDDALLLEALGAPVFLIGALGSRANHAGRLDRLRSAGADGGTLARIHGPVGLDIGSRTPAEISVAILAQLIAVRSAVAAG